MNTNAAVWIVMLIMLICVLGLHWHLDNNAMRICELDHSHDVCQTTLR